MDLGLFVPLTLLAFVATEGVVEYLLGTLFDKIEKIKPYSWTLMYASAAAGVGLAFFYKLDAMALVGLPASPVGLFVTGIFVGRGANFISDVFSLVGAKISEARSWAS
jgi:hypothetical protein